MIKAYCKMPERPLAEIDIFDDLPCLQEFVGGYIECVTITPGIVMICNEEGKLRGLEPNFRWMGDVVVGPVLFCGTIETEDGGAFTDMPLSFDEFKKSFEKIAKEVPHVR